MHVRMVLASPSASRPISRELLFSACVNDEAVGYADYFEARGVQRPAHGQFRHSGAETAGQGMLFHNQHRFTG